MAELLAPFAGDDAPKLALELRQRFGSLSRALKATPAQIAALGEPFAEIIRMLVAARNLVESAQRECLASGPVKATDPAIISYLRSRLCGNEHERLLAIFCDGSRQYLVDEEIAWGSADQVRVEMSHIFRRALTLDSSSILLAHNHPSGHCRPSAHDIEATRRLAATGKMLGCEIFDHVIVTQDKAYSMKAGGQF